MMSEVLGRGGGLSVIMGPLLAAGSWLVDPLKSILALLSPLAPIIECRLGVLFDKIPPALPPDTLYRGGGW